MQFKLSSSVSNYVFILILLCWYWYLFADANGTKWGGETLLWHTWLTLIVGGLIGRNCVTIGKYSKSRLKPYFYVTPIYFIKTEFDIVSFRPLWTLKDVAVTHNYRNGSYQNSKVVLKFEGHNESLCLSSRETVESLLNRMREYDSRLRSAFALGDQGYFLLNDDFHKVSRSITSAVALLSKEKQALVYVASGVVCVIGLLVAIATNEALSKKPLGRLQVPTTYSPEPAPSRVPSPSYPEQPLPDSGAVRTWAAGKRVAPLEIEADHGSNYLVKLVNVFTHDPAMTVFVRSGSTVEVKVPIGTYEIRYAAGETWYGYDYLFGPDTSYSKADKTFTFEAIGNQVGGFSITLYKVAHGNLPTSPIGQTEF